MDRLFIDTDIILDLIQKREPFYADALRLFELVEEGKLAAFVSPLIFANLYYILRKANSKAFAIHVLGRIKSLVRTLTLDEKIIDLALSCGFHDFEDATQYYAALEAGLEYLVTRNKADYKKPRLIVCTAKEYLAIRASKQQKESAMD